MAAGSDPCEAFPLRRTRACGFTHSPRGCVCGRLNRHQTASAAIPSQRSTRQPRNTGVTCDVHAVQVTLPLAPDLDSCSAWTGHVIVCGLHGEGVRIVEQFHLADVQVVVLDGSPDPALIETVSGYGVPYLRGDSRSPDVLQDAGLNGAAALLCVESDDLQTLATALLARELSPDLRIVVALRNAAVGRALTDIGIAVLDVARLSAPAVVEACLRSGTHTLQLGAQQLVVAEAVARRSGTLRELYGDLAPIGVVTARGAVEIAPSRDHHVTAGDRVVIIGSPQQVRTADLGLEPARDVTPVFVGARAPRQPRHRPTTLLRYLFTTVDRRLKLVLTALGVLIVISVTILSLGYREPDGTGMSLLDALYFTIETIGTVGFGDFYFRDQQPWLRAWAIALMLVGATMATVFFALLTNVLISQTIARSLGRRKVTGLNDHVIVIGLGSIGMAVVEGLRAAGTDVVVIETNEENRFLASLQQHQTPVVVADATLPETFDMVRLEHARAVAVMTSDDLINIETGLAVRDLLADRWAEVPVVLRIFDRRLAHTVETSFDFRYVRSTAALAAPWFVGAALGLDVLGTFYVGDQPMLVASLTVTTGSRLDGIAMRQLGARLRVVSLVHPDGTTNPAPRRDTQLGGGDLAYLIGPYEELLTVLRAASS